MKKLALILCICLLLAGCGLDSKKIASIKVMNTLNKRFGETIFKIEKISKKSKSCTPFCKSYYEMEVSTTELENNFIVEYEAENIIHDNLVDVLAAQSWNIHNLSTYINSEKNYILVQKKEQINDELNRAEYDKTDLEIEYRARYFYNIFNNLGRIPSLNDLINRCVYEVTLSIKKASLPTTIEIFEDVKILYPIFKGTYSIYNDKSFTIIYKTIDNFVIVTVNPKTKKVTWNNSEDYVFEFNEIFEK